MPMRILEAEGITMETDYQRSSAYRLSHHCNIRGGVVRILCNSDFFPPTRAQYTRNARKLTLLTLQFKIHFMAFFLDVFLFSHHPAFSKKQTPMGWFPPIPLLILFYCLFVFGAVAEKCSNTESYIKWPLWQLQQDIQYLQRWPSEDFNHSIFMRL